MKRPSWALLMIFLSAVLLIPLLYILVSSVIQSNENWKHLIRLLLPRYLKQTLVLVLGVGAGTGIMGVWSAWIFTRFRFPGKRLLEIFCYLPLAVPAYIMAFVYGEFFSITGAYSRLLQNLFGHGDFSLPNVMNMGGLIGVMSLALFPYVFSAARGAFKLLSPDLLEAASSMGVSPSRGFWTIALPLARPAVAAGISLALMETLSEYGAVSYFGVENFTTGIFRAWFTLQDPPLALKLAGILLLFTFGIIMIEQKSRGKSRKYAMLSHSSRPLEAKPLKGFKLIFNLVIVFFPISFGFLLPVFLLLLWGIPRMGEVTIQLAGHLLQSFSLGGAAALLIIITALLLVHGKNVLQRRGINRLTRFISLGYGIPGAVLALAVLVSFNGTLHFLKDRGIISLEAARFLLIKLGILSLFLAYVIRYLAVAYNPLDAHYHRIGHRLTEASLGLGVSPFVTLIRSNIPVLKGPLLFSSLLVFIDLIKELPMTLILRPFNMETLATQAYYYASNEMLRKAAPYSLTIVLLCAIPTLILAFMGRDKKEAPLVKIKH